MINPTVLNQKLQALTRFPVLEPDLVRRFGEVLKGLDDWDLFRINPVRFAREHQLPQAATVDLFVHAARIGLFDFAYHMFCPGCGGIEHSHNALDQIEADIFHCTNCDMDVQSNLDQQVQVSFTLNPAVGTLHLDPYAGPGTYSRYFSSREMEMPPAVQQYFVDECCGFVSMQPDSDGKVTFQAHPGALYRLMSWEAHTNLYLQANNEPAPLPQIVDIELLPNGFSPSKMEIACGEVTLHIHNRAKGQSGAVLHRLDFERLQVLFNETPSIYHPYLTGKMLLNNQSFRDLFRIQALAPDLRLNIQSLTILFTDLKSSTEMYDQVGDVLAYSLVQKHFDLLTQVVRQHSGSIIKTMGDAIMATFSDPQDGVRAALEIVRQMESLKPLFRDAGYETGIKVGLNEGPALAVNADERLDYFGQSVNVASRVQGLAETGEIWLTDSVFSSPGVPDLLQDYAYTFRKQSALLRGIHQPTIVYQCGQ